MKIQTVGLGIFGFLLGVIGLVALVPGVRERVQDIFWFVAKVAFFMYLYIWYRGTFPRYRFDQLMKVGWKVLLPTGLGVLIATAIAGLLPEISTAFWGCCDEFAATAAQNFSGRSGEGPEGHVQLSSAERGRHRAVSAGATARLPSVFAGSRACAWTEAGRFEMYRLQPVRAGLPGAVDRDQGRSQSGDQAQVSAYVDLRPEPLHVLRPVRRSLLDRRSGTDARTSRWLSTRAKAWCWTSAAAGKRP